MNKLITKYPELFKDQQHDYGCGAGWYPLIEAVCNYIKNKQNRYLSLKHPTNEHVTCGKSELPFFDFKFEQIKEKFGSLRIYHSVIKVQHDWNIFDEVKYEYDFHMASGAVYGFIDAIEIVLRLSCGLAPTANFVLGSTCASRLAYITKFSWSTNLSSTMALPPEVTLEVLFGSTKIMLL